MGRRKLPAIPPGTAAARNFGGETSSSQLTSGTSKSTLIYPPTYSAAVSTANSTVRRSTITFGSLPSTSTADIAYPLSISSSTDHFAPVYLNSSAAVSSQPIPIETSSRYFLQQKVGSTMAASSSSAPSSFLASGTSISAASTAFASPHSVPGQPSATRSFLPDVERSLSAAGRSSLYEMSRPSSACSTSSLGHGEPAIMAGSQFQSVNVPSTLTRPGRFAAAGPMSPNLRQPISMVGKPHRAAQATAKLPSTLARVKLKKELKEALGRRRESLEACEIEANQRQYVVHKMLVTGLLPERREEDDVPNVIPCLLPIELISGARIMPHRGASPGRLSQYDRFTPLSHFETPPPPADSTRSPRSLSTPGRREVAVSTEHYQPHGELQMNMHLRRTATSEYATPRARSDDSRLFHTPRYMRSEATQTEPPLTRDSPIFQRESRETRQREHTESHRERERFRKTDDLIESTRRYFEEYDRQLRDMGEKIKASAAKKNLNLTVEDDALSREKRRIQILDELDRRRNQRYRSLGEDLTSRDHSSYGDQFSSLPRMDPRGIRAYTGQRDFTHRDLDTTLPYPNYAYHYGSLPRNFERSGLYDPLSASTIQIDYEQAFGAEAGGGRSDPFYMSRSMHDLRNAPLDDYRYWERNNIQSTQPYRQYGRHSLNYLDQLDIDTDRLLLQPAYDNAHVPPNPSSLGSGGDMISQYASYLSRQFGDHQASAYCTSPQHPMQPKFPPPLQRTQTGYYDSSMPPYSSAYNAYEAPLSDPYAYRTSNGAENARTSPTYYTQPNYAATMPNAYGMPSTAMNDVYSRTENDYGSRPQHYSLDYGNIRRPRIQDQQQKFYQQPPNAFYAQQHQQQQPNFGIQPKYNQQWQSGGNAPRPSVAYPPTYQQHPSYPLSDSGRFGYPPQSYASQPLMETTIASSNMVNPGTRSWSNGNLRATTSSEDALTRMYASAGRRRTAAEDKKSSVNFPRLSYHSVPRTKRTTTFASQDDVISTSGTRSHAESAYRRSLNRHSASGNIKRILLTRKYKDHNIYNDLGVRVVGGKRTEKGELGAFVSAVNSARHTQVMGQLHEGDQILEWNGVLLTGKTFEEVERIVNASTGEVEIVAKSAPSMSSQGVSSTYRGEYDPFHSTTANEDHLYDTVPKRSTHLMRRDQSPELAPPVPQHQSNGGTTEGLASPDFDVYPPVNGYIRSGKQQQSQNASSLAADSLGHLQLSLSYEHASGRLIVRVLSARGLKQRDSSRGYAPPNPFCKIYLLPGRKVSHKRRTRFVPSCCDPEWNQMVEYDVSYNALPRMCLEFSLWDYDKFTENNSLGQVVVSLSDKHVLTGMPRWYRIECLDSVNSNRHSHHLYSNASQSNKSSNRNQGSHENGSRLSSNYNPASLDIGYPAIR